MHDTDGTTGAPHLSIHIAGDVYTVNAGDGPITIGRTLPAQIRVDDPRISRAHVRIQPHDDHWTLTDVGSRNGTFLDGRRIESAPVTDTLTVHLGNADGIAATLTISQRGVHDDLGTGIETPNEFDDGEIDDEATGESTAQADPGIARAGAAVAERRDELGLSQRKLNEDHVISQSVLVKFERGRHWPRERTRTKIEEYLRWPPGTIARIRAGAPIPEDESTEVLSATVQVAVLIDATEIALRGIHARMGLLPTITDPAFTHQSAVLLGELRRLQTTLANAARTTARGPQIALLLSGVRRTYADLVLQAARAPGATTGQRLYAARHHAALTAEELANAAGVTVDEINSAESDLPVAGPVAAAIENVIATLTQR